MGAPRGIRHGNFRHGHNGADGPSPTYKSWDNMITRCSRPCHGSYPEYGGAGITVCERWHDFANFLADMGERPSLHHSIDRWPDSHGNYEPGNCRWATRMQQSANSSKPRPVIRNGWKRYPSVIAAAKDVEVDYTNIVRCCRGERKSAGGYTWEYDVED
jgi:hypothetical protein